MDRKTHFCDGVLCSDVASTIVFLSFIVDKLAASLVYSFYSSKYKYYTRIRIFILIAKLSMTMIMQTL